MNQLRVTAAGDRLLDETHPAEQSLATQTVEVARVVACRPPIARVSGVSEDGKRVESHSQEPPKLEQLRTVLEYVQHSLCHVTLGNGGDPVRIAPTDLRVRPTQWPTQVDGRDDLEFGYELTVVLPSSRQAVTAEETSLLRAEARSAAQRLHSGDLVVLDSLAEPEEKVAAELHRKMHGKRIPTPFYFRNFTEDEIFFFNEFKGEEERGEAMDPITLVGHIRTVTYLGDTLSFIFESLGSPGSRASRRQVLTIEYAPALLGQVHDFAIPSMLPVAVDCSVHGIYQKSGQLKLTYSVDFIDRASDDWHKEPSVPLSHTFDDGEEYLRASTDASMDDVLLAALADYVQA